MVYYIRHIHDYWLYKTDTARTAKQWEKYMLKGMTLPSSYEDEPEYPPFSFCHIWKYHQYLVDTGYPDHDKHDLYASLTRGET